MTNFRCAGVFNIPCHFSSSPAYAVLFIKYALSPLSSSLDAFVSPCAHTDAALVTPLLPCYQRTCKEFLPPPPISHGENNARLSSFLFSLVDRLLFVAFDHRRVFSREGTWRVFPGSAANFGNLVIRLYGVTQSIQKLVFVYSRYFDFYH